MGSYYWILNMISKGQKGLAIKELTKILKADSRDLEAWSLLALAVDETGKKADCYRQILRIDPGNQHAQSNLQALLTPPAADGVEKEAQIEPVAAPIMAAPKMAAPKMAAPTAPKVTPPLEEVNSIPDQAVELLERGKNEFRIGNKPAGREWIRQAVQLNPANDEAWLEYIQAANTEELRLKIIQRWLDYDPENPKARQAMEELQSNRSNAVKPASAAKKSRQERTRDADKVAGNSAGNFAGNFANKKKGCVSMLAAFILGTVLVSITTSIAMAPVYLVLGPYKASPTTDPEALAMVVTVILSLVVLLILWYLLDLAWTPRIRYPMIALAVQFFVLITPLGWFFVGKGALLLIEDWRDRMAG